MSNPLAATSVATRTGNFPSRKPYCVCTKEERKREKAGGESEKEEGEEGEKGRKKREKEGGEGEKEGKEREKVRERRKEVRERRKEGGEKEGRRGKRIKGGWGGGGRLQYKAHCLPQTSC